MLRRLKNLGSLLVLFGIGSLFLFTPIGEILGHKLLFYMGIVLTFVCFIVALKVVGFPPIFKTLLKNNKRPSKYEN